MHRRSMLRAVRAAFASLPVIAIGLFVSVSSVLGAGWLTDDPDGNPPSATSWIFDPSLAPMSEDALQLGDRPQEPERGATIEYVYAGSDPEGDSPTSVAFTPNGTQVLIAHGESRNVLVWNEDGTFDSSIDVSGSPYGLAVSPDGSLAVTANLFEDSASILDLDTGLEVAVIPVGDQPGIVAINPSGTLAAVGNTVEGSISILELPSGNEARRIAGVGFVGSVSVNFENASIGARFYPFHFVDDATLVHADFYADQVHFVDATVGTILSIPVSDAPQAVAVSADRSVAVVSHTGSNQRLTVLDTATRTITKVIPTGVDLNAALTVNNDGTQAVVGIQNACIVVDLVTNGISPSIDTASVNEIYTTSDGLYALCVGFRGSLIRWATQSLVKNLNNLVSCSFGAVSPVAPRAAMVANNFGEDLLFLDTDGAAGFLDIATLSGPADEGDKARLLALSPDGTIAAVTHILSDNVGFFDLNSLSVLGYVDTGDRPAEVAFTPDGTTAVIANLDSPFATVVDVGTLTATNVPLSTRGGPVEISPDGRYAYVAVVSADGVWRIDLDVPALDGPKIVTGNMGGISYLYSRMSGMTLSHDGSVLVTCNSFTDDLTFIDTASWTRLGNLPVGDFPVRALFNEDDSELYVSCRDDDRVRVVDVTSRTVVATIAVGDWPFEAVLSPDESTLYVLNYLSQNVGVIDLELGAQVNTIPLPNAPGGIALSSAGSEIYVPTGTWSVSIGPGPLLGISRSGELNVIDRGSETIVEQYDTGVPPSTLAAGDGDNRIVVPSTFIDGIYVVDRTPGASPEGAPDRRGTLSATPQPAREAVRIGFSLEQPGRVEITLHDARGRLVRTLMDQDLTAGEHASSWDRHDERGARVDAGVYFLRLRSGDSSWSRKIVVR